MEKFTIADAFRAFELEEENEKEEELSKSFNLNDAKEVKDAAVFLAKETPKENTEIIIDVDADEVEDLQKSYVGELVLQCPVCNTLISKKEPDVHCDEEDESLCNVGEECPTCHSDSGFNLVGKLAPVEETTEVKVDETENTDGIEKSLDIDKDIKVEDDFDLEDAFDVEDESLNEDTVKQGNKWVNKGKEGTHGTFKTKKAADAQRKAMFASGYKGESLTESQSQEIARYWNDIDEENDAPISDFAEIFIRETPDLKSKGKMDILFDREDWSRFEKWLKDTKGIELKKSEELAMDDALEEGLTKAQRLNKSYDKVFDNYKKDIKHMKDFLSKKGISDTEIAELEKNTGLNGNALRKKIIDLGFEDEFKKEVCKLTEAPILEPRYDARKSFYNKAETREENGETILSSYGVDVAKIKDGKVTLLPKWDFSQTTLRHVKEFLRQHGFKADSKMQILKDYVNESLAEEFVYRVTYKYSPETFSSVMIRATSEDEAKKKFAARNDKEVIGVKKLSTDEVEDMKHRGMSVLESKVNTGVKDDIEEVDIHKEDSVVTEPVVTSEVAPKAASTAIEVEDEFVIDESTYEPLVNKFLVETYENVKDYKLTKSTCNGNKVCLEGIITFKSGNTTPTKFILASSPFKKVEKTKLVGMNETFSKSRKSFVFTGNKVDNKFVFESFNYSYSVKTLNEGVTDTKRISGRITLK